MSRDFDPHAAWLGIAASERPCDHYRLLGLPRFESNSQTIAAAADQRMALVRGFQTGPLAPYTQSVLNELATARVTLLEPGLKQSYDAGLHARAELPELLPQGAALPPNVRWEEDGLLPPGAPPPPPPGAMGPPPPPPPADLGLPVPLPAASVVAPVELAPGVAPVATRGAIARPVAARAPSAVAAAGPGASAPAGEAAPTANAAAPWRRRPAVWAVAGGVLLLTLALGWMLGSWFSRRPPEPLAPVAPTLPPPKAPPSPAEDTAFVAIHQEANGDVNLTPALAKLSGEHLKLGLRGQENVLDGWNTPDAAASWQFKLARPGAFRVEITYLAASDAEGGQFELRVGDSRAKGEARLSERPGEYVTDELFLTVPRPGVHALTLKPVALTGAALFELKSIRLRPARLPAVGAQPSAVEPPATDGL